MHLENEKGARTSEGCDGAQESGREHARAAVDKARKVVELLEEAFELMAEDDPIQPAIESLYTVLHEAGIWAAVLEDWRRRTYLQEERCRGA